MEKNEEVILKAMHKAGKPLKAGDLAQLTGIDKEVVTKLIAKMKKQGLVVSPKACFYVASEKK